MDAHYLKQNVNEALMEAITAMAIALPEDRIEYIGKYLLQYVERKSILEAGKIALINADDKLMSSLASDEITNQAKNLKRDEEEQKAQNLPNFIDSFSKDKFDTKKDALDRVTSFIAENLDIPASYIAVRKVVGETETLHYISSNPGQECVLGKKLVKVVDENPDEPTLRAGLSFDAFKIPEVIEEDPVELAEGEEPPPPKPAPTAQPIIVENVMREKKCKFYGIPKLGAYAAIPFSYSSIDHEQGCVATPPPEEGETASSDPFSKNSIPTPFIIAIDTIGKYRTIRESDISAAQAIGNALIPILENIEDDMFKKQSGFLNDHKDAGASFADLATKMGPEEETTIASIAAMLAAETKEPVEGEDPPEPPPESIKAWKEAVAVADIWSSAVTTPSCITFIEMLQQHVLPAPQVCTNLLYVTSILVGMNPDQLKEFGELSWDSIRNKSLPVICEKIKNYNPSLQRKMLRESTVVDLKKICEASQLLDASVYPPHLPAFAALCTWLPKAFAAREAAIAYFREVKKVELEVIV
jgi:hypothetical protein